MTRICDYLVVGAGISGLALSRLLEKKGRSVILVEQRPDVTSPSHRGASINLTLSFRGLKTLDLCGLSQKVTERSIEINRRVIHKAKKVTYLPYYAGRSSGMYSIRRSDLLSTLIEDLPENVVYLPGHKLINLNKDEREVTVKSDAGGSFQVRAKRTIFGTDGVFSTVRREMQKREFADFEQSFDPRAYKEFSIDPASARRARLELDGAHIWPIGENRLIFALPNPDGSFVGNLVIPRSQLEEFEDLDAYYHLLASKCPALSEALAGITDELASLPWRGLASMKTNFWHYRDRVCLVGESAHATIHFYAQGVNACLEDVYELTSLLGGSQADDHEMAFKSFQTVRKPQTDLLQDLSKENFKTLSSRCSSSFYVAKEIIRTKIEELTKGLVPKTYNLIAGTDTPYTKAYNEKPSALHWSSIASSLLGLLYPLWLHRFQRKEHLTETSSTTKKRAAPKELAAEIG